MAKSAAGANAHINIFSDESKEREQLEMAAGAMNAKCHARYVFSVGETYFDFGQDWKWTTIIREDLSQKAGSVLRYVQALTPKDQEDILFGTEKEFTEAVNRVLGKCGN